MIDRAKGCELYVSTKKTQRLQKRKCNSPQRCLPTYSYTVYIADAVRTKNTSFTGDDVNSPFFDDRHPPRATLLKSTPSSAQTTCWFRLVVSIVAAPLLLL